MMEDKKMITIKNMDGSEEQVEEVVTFEFNDTKKRYLVYTKNEVDQNENITIYVTEVVKDEEGTKLLGVSTDEEWSRIKDVLRKLAKRDEA